MVLIDCDTNYGHVWLTRSNIFYVEWERTGRGTIMAVCHKEACILVHRPRRQHHHPRRHRQRECGGRWAPRRPAGRPQWAIIGDDEADNTADIIIIT